MNAVRMGRWYSGGESGGESGGSACESESEAAWGLEESGASERDGEGSWRGAAERCCAPDPLQIPHTLGGDV